MLSESHSAMATTLTQAGMSVNIVLKISDHVLWLFSWETQANEAVAICFIRIAALKCKSKPTRRVLHVDLAAPVAMSRSRHV